MATSRLGKHVSWLQVFPQLDENWVSQLGTTLLPQAFPCPFCNAAPLPAGVSRTPKHAVIYSDFVRGGQWIHCPACGFAGDVIEFAARKWELDPVTTVRELHGRGIGPTDEMMVPENLSAYRNDLAVAAAWRETWRKAQDLLLRQETPHIKALIHRIGIADDVSHAEWPRRGGQFIGAADMMELFKQFRPGSSRPRWRKNDSGKPYLHPCTPRSWLGTKETWQPAALLLPCYDLPGRLVAFMLLGQTLQNEVRLVSKLAHYDGNSSGGVGGLWMFDNLRLSDEAVVFGDPLAALMLQLRNFRDSPKPLPLAAMHAQASFLPSRVWLQNWRKSYVFWSPNLDASLFDQARRAGGKIAQLSLDREQFRRVLAEQSACAWLQTLKQTAVAWPTALERQLKLLPDVRAKDLILALNLSRVNSRHYLENISPAGIARYTHLVPEAAVKEVVCGNRVVQEDAQGWIHKKNGCRILNGFLRIQELIYEGSLPDEDEFLLRPRSRRRYWRGQFVLPDGAIHPFTVLARNDRQVRRCTIEFIEQMAERGVMAQVGRGWAPAIWDIAQLFHEPMLATGCQRVGWNAERGCFVFPQFAVAANGDIDQASLMILLHDTPCRNLFPPTELLALEIEALGQDHAAVQTVWAVAAYIAHQLLAPLMGFEPCGLLLLGAEAPRAIDWLGPLLHLHTLQCTAGSGSSREVNRAIRNSCQRHDWPGIVKSARHRGNCLRGLLGKHRWLPFVVVPQWHSGRAAMTLNGWAALQIHQGSHSSQLPAAAGEKLVFSYLRDVLARQLPIDGREGGWIKAILADMRTWFRSLGGETSPIAAASRQIQESSHTPAWPWALELLQRSQGLGDRGRIRITPKPHPSVENPKQVWISLLELENYLEDHHAPWLDLEAVTQSFHESGVWFRDEEQDGTPGWLFDFTWWTKELRLWRSNAIGAKTLSGQGE